MFADFRSTMAWLHTWAGVILGSVMFVMFFLGTLSVFKVEIDRWMMPSTRIAATNAPVSLDAIYQKTVELAGPELRTVTIFPGKASNPAYMVRVITTDRERFENYIDPATLEWLGRPDTRSAKYFLYPMHYRLGLPYGRWISASAAMFMLLVMLSGVVIHRKIFVDFFTFRRKKKLPRASLDLHNLSSLLALPFHILITLSGIVILISLYFAPTLEAVYPDSERPRNDFYGEITSWHVERPSGVDAVGPLVSLDALKEKAAPYWRGQGVGTVVIQNPLDAAGYVTFLRSPKTEVSSKKLRVVFDADTGDLIKAPSMTAGYEVKTWLAGFHEIHFDHWLLRWFYFFAGGAGCVMIATGYIYWMETRRRKYARQAWPGVRIVEGFSVWGVMGLMNATAAFFVANKVLPPGLWAWGGTARPEWETNVFYLVWFGALAHGWIRGKHAWGEQAWLLATLCGLAVMLNWIVTGDHLFATVLAEDWALASMDGLLILTAIVSIAAARRVGRANRAAPASKIPRAVASPAE